MTPQRATRGQEPIFENVAKVVTRFAPSPTGRLHLGHAYAALMAHDFARARGGRFLLRIEDIDAGRSRPEHVAGIFEDLTWLGLSWDGEATYQSQRLPLYAAALERLKAAGLLYPCFCTRKDIAASATAPHPESEPGAGGPEGTVYPGTCRGLTESEQARRTEAEAHAWRLDMASAVAATRACELTWRDHDRLIPAHPAPFGDVVLARKDAPVSYHLAVTVDDAAQGITDVVRGEDLFAATHVHRLLQALLELPTPHYHHHKLIRDQDGERLAKRHGAPSLEQLRADGGDPEAIVEALRDGRLPAGNPPASA